MLIFQAICEGRDIDPIDSIDLIICIELMGSAWANSIDIMHVIYSMSLMRLIWHDVGGITINDPVGVGEVK